jgi:hypothetical protein
MSTTECASKFKCIFMPSSEELHPLEISKSQIIIDKDACESLYSLFSWQRGYECGTAGFLAV